MNCPYIAVIADLGSHCARNAFRGIADYIRLLSGGYDLVLQTRLAWQECKPAGIIVLIHKKSMLKTLRESHVPVVNIGEQVAQTGFPTVVADAEEVGRLAALHLLAAGFAHFGYYGEKGVVYHLRRGQGFIRALREKGHGCESYFSATNPARRRLAHERKQLEQWLLQLPKPAGIMCGSDWTAWSIYDACKRSQIKIPAEVALVGVDNDELFCETYAPTLSSVDIDFRRIGYEAAALLFRLLAGQPAPARPVLIKPRGFIQRRSSDVFISNDPHVSTVVQYIRRHIDEPLGVAALLKLAPLSRRVLERRFHRGLGWSMRAEIHRCKIERIKQLLGGTTLTMTKIAEQTGFSGLSHMGFLFRKETGLTLHAYRVKARS